MTRLMEHAIERVRGLPESDQDEIASIILLEIESERRWDELFARPKSAELLSRMADQALISTRLSRARQPGLDRL